MNSRRPSSVSHELIGCGLCRRMVPSASGTKESISTQKMSRSRDRPQDLEVAFGLGVEIQIEQDVDIRAGPVAQCFEVHDQIAQYAAFDIEVGCERHAEAGSPALRALLVLVVGEDVGLQRGEAFLAHFAADRLDAIEIGDRRFVVGRVIDPPGGAMRPVHADAVADLAAEQFVDRHAESPGLGIEQRVLDRAHGERDDAAGGRAGGANRVRHRCARARRLPGR